MWMNVTLNITSVPDQEAFLVDATTVTPSGHRWIEAKAGVDAEFEPAQWVEMCSRAGEELAADVIADPRGALIEESGELAGFEARLEAIWGRGLDLADLVISEVYGAGRWVNDLLGPSAPARQDHKFEALIRLHGKALLTAREVFTLLRRGYSSGAFARWRTLHEVRVVLLLLADGDEELSRRYLAHEHVDAFKGQEEYERAWETMGHERPDWSADERKQHRAELVEEFGDDFLGDYGWAAPLFDNKAPRGFRPLEGLVELDPWRHYYRLASQGVHANAGGITGNIQDLAETDIIWAGPSDAGLADPAQCSLIALADATDGLLAYAVGELAESEEVDAILNQSIALVRHHVIHALADQAITTLVDVGAHQESDEEARAEIVGRVTEILRGGESMTAQDLSTVLEADPEDVDDALATAAARGDLLQEMHYRLESPAQLSTGKLLKLGRWLADIKNRSN